MKNNTGFSVIILLIILGLVAGATVYVARENPSIFRTVEQKLKTMITPKPPIGNLTPSRDLKGTWTSAIRGKGIQLYGQFATGPSTTKVYEDGDVKLVINTVKNNIAYGNIRYTNLCSSGQTSVPGYGYISVPKQCTSDSGARPIQIRVSGSRLDFGTIATGSATFSMQGSYTTHIISGTMTMTTSYGVIKGEFHLNRVR